MNDESAKCMRVVLRGCRERGLVPMLLIAFADDSDEDSVAITIMPCAPGMSEEDAKAILEAALMRYTDYD